MVKLLRIASVVLLGLAPLGAAEPAATALATALDRAVVAEMSEARLRPAAYAAHLRALLPRFEGRLLKLGEGSYLRTQEGAGAVEEAIAFLEAQAPLGPLAFSEPLARAARDHVRDQGPSGATGHVGSRGETMRMRLDRRGRFEGAAGENINYGAETARDIVVQLLVDDAVPDRGHRHNIFNPDFKVAGAAVGPHARYGTMCVIDYADGFRGLEPKETPK